MLNFARLQLLAKNPNAKENWLKPNYKKSNLKLVYELLVECVAEIIKKLYLKVLMRIDQQIKRTIQARIRRSRSYERVKKYSAKSSYDFKNVVERRV